MTAPQDATERKTNFLGFDLAFSLKTTSVDVCCNPHPTRRDQSFGETTNWASGRLDTEGVILQSGSLTGTQLRAMTHTRLVRTRALAELFGILVRTETPDRWAESFRGHNDP